MSQLDAGYYCGAGVGEMANIVRYSVIDKVLPSVQIPSPKLYLHTLEGSKLWVQRLYGGSTKEVVYVNGATVVDSNVLAYNGYVHRPSLPVSYSKATPHPMFLLPPDAASST